MDAARNPRKGSVLGFDGHDPGDAIRPESTQPRDDRKECPASRLSLVPTSHAETGNLQSRGRVGNPRAVVRGKNGATGASPVPRADFYPRWINSPNDARFPLHGLLPQRLRDESISRE